MDIQNYFAQNMLHDVGNSYNNVKFFDFLLILALQAVREFSGSNPYYTRIVYGTIC